jgi:hypothetical protein
MIQRYWLTAILVGTTFSAPAIAMPQHSSSLTITQRPKVSRTIRNGDWQITLTEAKSLGRNINYDGVPYEAVGFWATATVTVRNTSSQRKAEDDAILPLYGATLVDTQGKSYETERMVKDFDLDGKPFSAGESRTYTMMFDTPAQVRMSYVKIEESYLGF